MKTIETKGHVMKASCNFENYELLLSTIARFKNEELKATT